MDFRGRDDELANSTNRFAIVIFAYLKAQESEGDQDLMFAWKLELTKRLSTKPEAEQVGLMQFFDALFPLPGDLDEHFWNTFSMTDEGKTMAFVTSLERISIKKGREQGLEQGREQGRLNQARKNVLEALEVRFGEVDASIGKKVKAVENVDTLSALLRRAITVGSLVEFVGALDLEK